MNRTLVFDAGVLTLHFAGRRQVADFFDAVSDGRARGLISAVNLAEFYYKVCKTQGKQVADGWYFQLLRSELAVVGEATLAKAAGLEKCRNGKRLSLADCYAVALARKESGLLLTTDSGVAEVEGVDVRRIEFKSA